MTNQTLDELNQTFAIEHAHNSLRIVRGAGDMPLIELHNAHATACISLYGGQVLSYRPHHAAQDLMFLSEKAIYQFGKAIRGGAPLCWPWFGPDPEQQGRPSHGFARTHLWQLIRTEATQDNTTRIVLGLNNTADTMAIWPHRFQLELELVVGTTLKITLRTHNLNSHPITITQAIHTYFAVGDITQTQVYGLAELNYQDKSKAGNKSIRTQSGAVLIESEVDRIYHNTPDTLLIQDSAWQRHIRIHSTGSQSAVVWNPWREIAAGMADLNNNDYQRYLCVETANVAEDAVIIDPHASHSLTTEHHIEPMS